MLTWMLDVPAGVGRDHSEENLEVFVVTGIILFLTPVWLSILGFCLQWSVLAAAPELGVPEGVLGICSYRLSFN